jgi:predicted DNA-binding transcriptional regulator AlpA
MSNKLSPPLPRYIRYRDLAAAGIVGSWMQLNRMMNTEGFPEGILISANIRAWPVDEIERWLASRPTAKKAIPEGAIPRGRRRQAEKRERAGEAA